MKTSTVQSVLAMVVTLAFANECPAGILGKAFREAGEAVTRRAGRAVRESAETLAEKGAGRLGAKGASGGARIVRASDELAGPVISKFGDDGARALGSLSPKGAERLAAMSDELAASGRGKDWMRLISERGDEATDWLWQRRGSVAVGTVATAILLRPEEFIQASERVATTTIATAGEHVARPIVEHSAAVVIWVAAWIFVILACASWLLGKERSLQIGRKLLVRGLEAITPRGQRRG